MVNQHFYALELMWKGKTEGPHTYDRSHIL